MATSSSNIYYIAQKYTNSRNGETRINIFAGTFEYLKNEVFYSCKTWNTRLAPMPKTIKAFVRRLTSESFKHGCYCYSYELTTKEEYEKQEARRAAIK